MATNVRGNLRYHNHLPHSSFTCSSMFITASAAAAAAALATLYCGLAHKHRGGIAAHSQAVLFFCKWASLLRFFERCSPPCSASMRNSRNLSAARSTTSDTGRRDLSAPTSAKISVQLIFLLVIPESRRGSHWLFVLFFPRIRRRSPKSCLAS